METKQQKGPRNRKLTVVVDAHTLYNLPPTEINVDAHTALSGDDGLENGFGDRNKTYETEVFLNYKMKWDIEVADKNGKDKDYLVQLHSVYHNPVKGNPNFFDGELIYSKDNGKTVEATVINRPILPDMEENYTIYFRITYSNISHYFPLDPKLRIRPQQ
ncbi:MAG: hypothetical protein ACWA5P_11805 [bacterium]